MNPGLLAPPAEPGGTAFARLAASPIVREAREAFREATGLRFELRPADAAADHGVPGVLAGRPDADFCERMSLSSPGCRECLADARRLAAQTPRGPAFTECFAGLLRVVVPVRVDADGGALVAFLRSAAMLVEPGAGPPAEFDEHVAPRALRRGAAKGDLPDLRRAFEATPRLTPARHAGAVRLLVSIANHLALLAAVLGPARPAPAELSPVGRARRIIGERLAGAPGIPLTLEALAAAVGVSAPYFSTLFHRETGQRFCDYLAHARYERALRLLACPHSRIRSVAEEAGFRSLSQFNRTFRRLAGCSPREFREACAANPPTPGA